MSPDVLEREAVLPAPRGTADRGVGQVAVAWIASVAVCALVVAEVFAGQGGWLRVNLPIAGSDGFPLPIVSWTALAAYLAWAGARLGWSGRRRFARGVVVAFGVHTLVLLAQLTQHLAENHRVELNGAYMYYCRAVFAMVVTVGLVALWRAARSWVRSTTHDPWLFLLPLAPAYAVFGGMTARYGPMVLLLGTVAGIIGCIAGDHPALLRIRDALRAAMTRRWFVAAAVFLAAFAIRLLYSRRILGTPDYLNAGSDGPLYDALAWSRVHGPAIKSQIPFFAPGYVRFLEAIYRIAGHRHAVVLTVQSLCGAFACVVAYDIARRLFGETVGRVTGALTAVNFLMTFAAASIGHQAMDVLWTLCVVWCLVCYVEQPRQWGRWTAAIGLLLGWAALTREGNIVFAWYIMAWMAIGMSLRIGRRRALVHTAMLAVAFFALLHAVAGRELVGLRDRVQQHWFYYPYTGFDINGWFNPWNHQDQAWRLLREQPLTVVARLGVGVVANFEYMFLNHGFGVFDPLFLVRWSPYFYGMWAYAWLLAFAGLALLVVRALRNPVARLADWLILGVLAARAGVHLVLEAGYRHRTPLEPFLVMLAAFALVRILRLDEPGATPESSLSTSDALEPAPVVA